MAISNPWLARSWPAPADPAAALRLTERFTALGEDEAALVSEPGGGAMLASLGGGSPFLSDLLLREHVAALVIARHGPAPVILRAMIALAETRHVAPRAQIASIMRQSKRRVALALAMADIGGLWGQAKVTGVLSALAEATLRLAVGHLLRAAHDAREITLPDPEQPEQGSGLTVLGMGKLGARELNYSSDIDLVLLFDPAAQPNHSDTLGAVFTRAARALVAMMEARDADGYVFRTDLRLRPDPAATPPAVALPAAIAYYESLGQNWERAAMIKARPVAGDLAVGAGFLEAIRPFIWRRTLDFAAIADIHTMKRRINAHHGLGVSGSQASIAGTDIKIAEGGIREIEFAAQTLQLVWGGRDPGLRDPATLGALRSLARAGHLPRRACAELTVAYRVLRQAEHRLQMVADRQTHAMPAKLDELARFATFMGCPDAGALAQHLARHMGRVRARYAEVFEAVPDLSTTEVAASLDLRGMDDPPATVDALQALGFRNAGSMIATLRGWQAGRLRALRSSRSRELMDAVLPSLLEELGKQSDPDAAFTRFDMLLSRLPAGVGLLSMIQRNPALPGRIAAVLGASPSLADHLSRVPSALEGLLAPAGPDPDPARTLRRRLADARTVEDTAAIIRNQVRSEEFGLCVAQMEGWLDVDAAGLARTALADAALAALLPPVLEAHAARYGWVRGGAMAVVALGKAGSAEMMAGSDLDLMLIYSHPPGVTESSGGTGVGRRMASSQWFIRTAHAYVAALTAPGAEGPIYAVDMRLRPSGNKGPVAVSLPAFRQYHAKDAWTWERMALTRARVIAGSPAIRARTEAAIAAALATSIEPARTRADAASMRGRLLRELPPAGPWDVKMRPGGGIEVEFIAQTL